MKGLYTVETTIRLSFYYESIHLEWNAGSDFASHPHSKKR